MKKIKTYLIFFIAIIHYPLIGQNIDSLLKVFNNTKLADSSRVKAIHSSARAFIKDNQDSLISLATQEVIFAQKTKQKKYEGRAFNLIGIGYLNKGYYPQALKYFFSALKIMEEIQDKSGISSTYINIGVIYKNQANNNEALKYYFKSLKITEQIKLKDPKNTFNNKLLASSYNNIGNIFDNQHNYPKALEYYFESLKLYEELDDPYGISSAYNNIGIIYNYQHNYNKALQMYVDALKIAEELDDKLQIATCYINIGALYAKVPKLPLPFRKKNMIYTNNPTGWATYYLTEALKICQFISNKDGIKDCYHNLTILDTITNNYQAAFAHSKLYVAYGDSLNNEETQKQSLQASMQYEFDKKELVTKAEQDKKDAIVKEEKQKQKIVIGLVSFVLLLVILFSFFLYKRFRITSKQKLIIEQQKVVVDKAYESLHEKNKEVMDSINYASRIQKALLPNENYIHKILNK